MQGAARTTTPCGRRWRYDEGLAARAPCCRAEALPSFEPGIDVTGGMEVRCPPDLGYPPSWSPLHTGATVADRFLIEHCASVGGTARVYRAKDLQTGMIVALKILYGEMAEDQMERLDREGEFLLGLDHPGIVKYVAHGELDSGAAFLAIEWLEGETLGQRLIRTGLSVKESVELAQRIAEILGYAHARGIVHRDIKPGNLILRDNDLARVVLIDFGIARGGQSGGSSITQAGSVLGTLGYMAPEQARGVGKIDARTDVFALGALLYKCLAGSPPFDADDPIAVITKLLHGDAPRVRDVRSDVPAELDELISRMLARNPDDRPADAGVVGAELAALGDLEPGSVMVGVTSGTEALMYAEQRLVSLVAVAAQGLPDEEATIVDGKWQGMKLIGRRLRLAVAPFAASLETLPNRMIVCTLAGRHSATDQAVRAARCVFAMRAAAPRVAMVLVTGRAMMDDGPLVGDALDRAVAMLEQEGIDASSPSASPTAALPIWVDEVTAGLLDGRFVVRREGAGIVLVGERSAQDAGRMLLGRPTPCVGRERELVLLESVFAECVSDDVARAVVVTGPAGAGKSRLRYETLRSLKMRGEAVELWVATGDPMHARSSFGMIAQIVRGAAGVLDGEPPSVQKQKIRARVARRVPRGEVRRVTQFLAELIGATSPGDEDVQLHAARGDARLMGDQMQRAWEDFIAAEAAAQPVVLVFEDLHWGDLPSVKLVDATLRVRGRPIMVFALARPEVHQLFPDLWAEHQPKILPLGDLSRKASERLVRQVLGEGADEPTVARIVATAGGNAFYLEELIRSVAEGHGPRLPDTVIAVAQGRIEALEPEARRVLRAASVFGKTFWTGGVTALFEGEFERAQVSSWLEELAERELVTRNEASRFRGEQEWTFRHDLLAQASHGMLTEKDKVGAHLRAAEWLEEVGESDPVALASHFEAGGAPRRAIMLWRRAAAQALEGSDLEAVIHYSERGIACGADGEVRGRLLLRKAEAQRWRGRYAEAERHAREAMALLPRTSTRFDRALAEAVEAASALGDDGRVKELVSLLSQRSQRGVTTAPHLVALSRATVALLRAGDYRSADGLLAYVDEAAPQLIDSNPNASGHVLATRGYRAAVHGDPALALSLYQDAIARFEEAGNARSAARALVESSSVCLELGAWGDAERDLRQALVSSERLGLASVTAGARHILSMALARTGRTDEALAQQSEAARAFSAQGDRRMMGASHVYGARILLEAGRVEEAEAEVRGALAVAQAAPHVNVYALAVLARALLDAGRVDDAREPIDEAMLELDGLGGIEEGESFVRVTYAETLAASGEPARAKRAILGARARIVARAELISDPQWRASFLERVEENARTLELAEAWE